MIHTRQPIGRAGPPALDARYPGGLPASQYHDNDFTVDYSRAPQPHYVPSQTSSHHNVQYPRYDNAIDLRPATMDPSMAALMATLRNNGSPYQPNMALPMEEEIYQQHRPSQAHLVNTDSLDFNQGYGDHVRGSQPRMDYTATEEYILRAHAESAAQRRRPPPLDLSHRRRGSSISSTNIAIGLRAHRAQAATIQLPPSQSNFQSNTSGHQPTISEDDFHANPGENYIVNRPPASLDDGSQNATARPMRGAQAPPMNARLSREPTFVQPQQIVQSHVPSSQYPVRNVHQHVHMRSTTLPPRSSSNQHQHQRHAQHSSMSIPIINKMRGSQQQQPHHHLSRGSLVNKAISINDPVGIYDDDHTAGSISQHTAHNYDSKVHFDNPRPYHTRGTHIYDLDQTSPSVVSPALTYASQSPSTLSPATPFFGSFANPADGFERSGLENKKVRAGSH